jgi:LacI family transcriptional regulator
VPTICDVARHAGVHQTTVSVVLNGGRSTARVSEATRQRIVKAAEELRYSPNLMARGLKNIRLNLLGVTFQYQDPTWITSDYYGISILTGIIGGAHAAGYSTALFHKTWRDARQSAAGFRGQGIDGFLVVTPLPDSDMLSGLSSLGVPVVSISAAADGHGVPSVIVDNARGVQMMVDHLTGLGHTRIAHVMDDTRQYDTVARREAFVASLEARGIPLPPEYMISINYSRPNAFYESTRQLMTLPNPPTSIFATNDGIAFGIMDAARALGIKIPDQLSIVGFDGDPRCERMDPPMTSVRQPLIDIGREAARLLTALVEGEIVPSQTTMFDPELVVRHSTARPAISA